MIAQHSGQRILAVVDGAAFGSEIQDCMDLMSGTDRDVSLYAPESFEYLILRSGVIEVPRTVTEETWDYADSMKFFSWEEFYTGYLSDITRNDVSQYSKGKLSEYYKTAGHLDKISSILPECIRELM